MKKSVNAETDDNSEPNVLGQMLHDMEVLSLIEFKADAPGGGCWVVSQQKNQQAEGVEQDIAAAESPSLAA